MNRTMLVSMYLAAFLIAVTPALGNAAPPADEPAQIGRYQLVAGSDGTVYVIDTTSGHCWSKAKDGKWIDEGSPARGKAKPERDPLSLNLPEESVQLTVQQRRTKPIPGSGKRILLHMGDLTEGQAILSVRSDENETLLDDTSVREGDVVEFVVGKKRYFIRVRELKNIFVGDDFGVFEVSSRRPAQDRRSGSNGRSVEQDDQREHIR